MLRTRFKYACVSVSFLAAAACFFSGATMTAVMLLCTSLTAIFINWGNTIDTASLKELIETLHPNSRATGETSEPGLCGYHANWGAIVTTSTKSHVIFRDEISASEWRELITRLKHGSVLRAKPRQTTNRFGF
jgi:hypothetical protein